MARAATARGARGKSFFVSRVAPALTVAGFLLYAISAPHSIAGAWIGLSLAALGWLIRALATKTIGLPSRTALDLPLWLFFLWSVLSSLFSAEPRMSLLKLGSVSTFLVFYLTQEALLTRRALALTLVVLMIASGAAGALWSAGEVVRGRGIVIEAMASDSPFRMATPLHTGDAIWRAGKRRVASVGEIDDAIRLAPVGEPLPISVISQGEHVEWVGPVVTREMKAAPAPSGLSGSRRTHRFRASGWTRHYVTFAEVLQILAQLALGLALAALQRKHLDGWRLRAALAATACALLAIGIALTAMRTVLVAFAIGAGVVAWRAVAAATAGGARRTPRGVGVAIPLAVLLALALGAFSVWQTRARGALLFQDASAMMRWKVARAALWRIPQHPVFGHGMDAVNLHWDEWGFPGTERIHMHSTPLQIAFDRGLPALILWLWIIAGCWLITARTEKAWRASDMAGAHGLLLGATGALAGFTASSLVNYNFGDAEVALLLWWLMGAVVAIEKGGR